MFRLTGLPFLAVLALVVCAAPQASHALVSFGKVRVIDPIGQPTDSERDFEPRITAMGDGVWIAAWSTDNDLGVRRRNIAEKI